MISKWHRLNLSQEDLPPLLFQYSADRQGYGVYVTDLTSIWSERLSHGEILGRADKTATTIDPSEDSEQLDVLLAKIGEALRGDGGSATLNSGSDADSLELTTSNKLPAPLKPLQWSFDLVKEGQSALTDKLLLPLLKEEAGWESRQRALLDQLKQKDWVLGKLLDKAEALSVDLGTVFPGAAGLRPGRKGSTRSEAAKLIKGIAPFDESAWLAESESKSGSLGLAANLFNEILGSHDSSQLERLHPAQDKWWAVLQQRSETSIVKAKEPAPEEVQSKTSKVPPKPLQVALKRDEDSATESEDDEFQREETPPRFKARKQESAISPPRAKTKNISSKSPSPQPPALEVGEATASESELEPEPEPAPLPRHTPSPPPPKPKTIPPSPKEAPKKSRSGLGTIGGKKKQEKVPQREPSPEPALSPQGHQRQAERQEQDAASPKAKRATKLGMIGGKAKAKAKATELEKSSSQAEPTGPVERHPPAQSPETDRLAVESTGTKQSPEPKSRPSESSEPVAAAPETEEERANRKREELKRQLQTQSKAPAKKKRRF